MGRFGGYRGLRVHSQSNGTGRDSQLETGAISRLHEGRRNLRANKAKTTTFTMYPYFSSLTTRRDSDKKARSHWGIGFRGLGA